MGETNMEALVIYNPNSGKKTGYDLCKICDEVLKEYGYDVTLVKTEYPNHAKEIVKQCKHYDIVFSIGGDGTLNEVISGNYEREDKLNICPLPSGSCNDVASMLGYGRDPKKNLEDALEGELHDFDVGTINDQPFAYVVGYGKFMNIPYEADREEKKKLGYLSYIKLGAKEVVKKMKRYKTKVTVDGKRLDGKYSLIMVSNSNHIAGIHHFYKDIALNDDIFEILLCKAENIADMAIQFVKFYLGIKTDKIISLNGHTIDIKIDEKATDWCVDGERLDDKSENYTIKVNSKMKVLTPRRASERRLFVE